MTCPYDNSNNDGTTYQDPCYICKLNLPRAKRGKTLCIVFRLLLAEPFHKAAVVLADKIVEYHGYNLPIEPYHFPVEINEFLEAKKRLEATIE